VRSPIGIGIGGKSPTEIAISVAAEILAVRDGRDVRALERDRAEA
jgi:xanthine dehydrogenase accessory factor